MFVCSDFDGVLIFNDVYHGKLCCHNICTIEKLQYPKMKSENVQISQSKPDNMWTKVQIHNCIFCWASKAWNMTIICDGNPLQKYHNTKADMDAMYRKLKESTDKMLFSCFRVHNIYWLHNRKIWKYDCMSFNVAIRFLSLFVCPIEMANTYSENEHKYTITQKLCMERLRKYFFFLQIHCY